MKGILMVLSLLRISFNPRIKSNTYLENFSDLMWQKHDIELRKHGESYIKCQLRLLKMRS